MLMKRTVSVQKEAGQMTKSDSNLYSGLQSDLRRQNCRSNSLFSIPGLYPGFNPKGLADADSVRSPTSPLDFMLFPYLSSPKRSPRSPCAGQRKSWDCSKVGLSIIDSLDDNGNLNGQAVRSFHAGNIIFGPNIGVKNHNFETNSSSIELPKSLPKDYTFSRYASAKSPLHSSSTYVVFEIADGPVEPDPLGKIRSSSLDSCTIMSYRPQLIRESPKSSKVSCTSPTSIPLPVDPGRGLADSLSASEIELSEDYTCVISHGPDSKTTHIYGDCILECHPNELSNFVKEIEEDTVLPGAKSSETPALYSHDDFLSFCCTCKKPLPEGEDIYIYRGEKAFCSVECRSKEVLSDEIEEAVDDHDKSPKSKSGDGLYQSGSFLPS
ncbi:hypothetical protein BT93_C0977 [Corymbia citriodora subsp. variegata]|nr:hypothetical protein BT93_C0977 [Corymbia citriodora subsp. variegata]KAF8034817.1 hypothetical protein BT93_C0977 [Corymbia citriodora subsp. variegata]KAF8034818.1 hypothetical protein BT93_C0977 [Corymbia citriodora subsp. variegata]